MKIVHLCLACFYIEGMEYQENVLPRKHKQLGHDVEVITSQYCFDAKGNVFDREVGEYVNKDDVKVEVLPYSKKYGKYGKNFKFFDDLYKRLEAIKPDVIFCHGAHFSSVGQLIKYMKKNPSVKLYADSHSDYRTAPVNTWKKKLMRRYFFGRQYRKLESYCEKIWGTLPARVEYLKDIYGVNPDKVDLLVMGGDVEKIEPEERKAIRARIRKKYDIDESTFLIITGGIIKREKNIHLLMEAVSKIKDKNINLVVFGKSNEDMESCVGHLANSDNIKMIGWLLPTDVYDLFYAADLAVFPGTHSVLWENVCACGLPAIFKGTEGEGHVDMGGNCQFLYKDDVSEIEEKLLDIIENQEMYNNMKKIAIERGYSTFSYMEIAKKAIGL
ncbi:MAG: glycosyltransferase family 4 protein [Planctomycetes bacterium]|nr:glycosyltransferase family 4 protein [Planctomycetota bacterium]